MTPQGEYVVAADLGGTNFKCALMDRDGALSRASSRPALADRPQQEVVDNIIQAIDETLTQPRKPDGELRGIGIGLPGIVYGEQGVLHSASNFPHCRDLPLSELIRERFDLPTAIIHDVDAAALAEHRLGAGRGRQHIVCITVGTGVGVGLILNGLPYTGAKHSAGNLGHMVVRKTDIDAPCHAEEILERQAAVPAIRRRAIRAVKGGAATLLREACGNNPETIDAEMVFEVAAGGDELARRIVDQAARTLGVAIANVFNLLSPEVIIIGGGLAQAGEPFFRNIRRTVDEYAYHFPDIEINIVPAELGVRAVQIGAGLLAWERLDAGDSPGVAGT